MDRFTMLDGEDVAPEFIKAEELGDYEDNPRIDVAPQTSDRTIAATVCGVAVSNGLVTVHTEEFAFPFIIPADTLVYFADDES